MPEPISNASRTDLKIVGLIDFFFIDNHPGTTVASGVVINNSFLSGVFAGTRHPAAFEPDVFGEKDKPII
jgi:hypothetical protein